MVFEAWERVQIPKELKLMTEGLVWFLAIGHYTV